MTWILYNVIMQLMFDIPRFHNFRVAFMLFLSNVACLY